MSSRQDVKLLNVSRYGSNHKVAKLLLAGRRYCIYRAGDIDNDLAEGVQLAAQSIFIHILEEGQVGLDEACCAEILHLRNCRPVCSCEKVCLHLKNIEVASESPLALATLC